jgi:hypothetical protein
MTPNTGHGRRAVITHSRTGHALFPGITPAHTKVNKAPLGLHLVLDNYATHKAPVIQQWLIKHPRFHRRLILANSSWLI